MKKCKVLLLAAMMVLSLFAVTSCGGGEKLYVFNCADYIDPDILKEFKKETGITVVYSMFDSNEAMYAKVKASGGYDVLFPSDYMIERMMQEGMLQKINMDNVPNAANIGDQFKGLAHDPTNEYAVTYMWGTLGIMYNKTKVTEPVDSWDILWDPAYAGQIFIYDSQRDLLGAALKRLGYSLNTHDMNELTAARDSLIAQKLLVQAYLTDSIKDSMISNQGALALTYSGDAVVCYQENQDLAFSIPKEGSNLWFDAMVIPKDAKNKDNAEIFINFMCRPDIAAKNSEYIGYTTANEAAGKFMDAETVAHPAYWPTDEELARCEVFRYLGEYLKDYEKVWNDIFITK